MRLLFSKILLSVLVSSCLAAAPAPITVSSVVDKSKITIGDLIRYRVTVSHGAEVQVDLPGPGANLGGFEIRGYQVREPKREKDNIVHSAEYTISTFLTGEFAIPPLTIAYKMPGDTVSRFLSTESIKITVESVKPSEAGDIRDIKPPFEIPRNWWLVARNVGIVLFVLGLAILGIAGYRRHKQGKSLLPVRSEPPRPPHEIALEAINRLIQSGLLENGEIKQFYVELSEIVRRYLEGRYFITAMEMTTTEVLDNMASASVSSEDVELVKSFLETCDLVKFAKYVPTAEENEATVKSAFELVERTKIVIETPATDPVLQDAPIESEVETQESKG